MQPFSAARSLIPKGAFSLSLRCLSTSPALSGAYFPRYTNVPVSAFVRSTIEHNYSKQ